MGGLFTKSNANTPDNSANTSLPITNAQTNAQKIATTIAPTNSSSIVSTNAQKQSQQANVLLYDIRNHKEYPALVKQFEKDCDKLNMLSKIDELNKQVIDLQLSLKYFDVPNSREYKELLYKYNEDIPKIYLPKQYPVSAKITHEQPTSQPNLVINNVSNASNESRYYNITDWTKTATFPKKLNLLNIVDTYPYS